VGGDGRLRLKALHQAALRKLCPSRASGRRAGLHNGEARSRPTFLHDNTYFLFY